MQPNGTVKQHSQRVVPNGTAKYYGQMGTKQHCQAAPPNYMATADSTSPMTPSMTSPQATRLH